MTVLLVALGAAVGAPARFLTDVAVTRHWRRAFPLGTFIVNIVASFVLGLTVGAAAGLSPQLRALIATGFCGALSTFSTFSYETMSLGRGGKSVTAVGYVVISVVASMGAGALGWTIAA